MTRNQKKKKNKKRHKHRLKVETQPKFDIHDVKKNRNKKSGSDIVEDPTNIVSKYLFTEELKYFCSPVYNYRCVSMKKLPADIADKTSAMPWCTEMNDDYIEFQRSTCWIASEPFLSFILSFCGIGSLLLIISIFVIGYIPDLLLIYLICIYSCLMLPQLIYRSFFTPYVLPVRMNRKTRKVYCANLKWVGGRFFSRQIVFFHEMDWENIQAWAVKMTFAKNTPYYGLHIVETSSEKSIPLQQSCLYQTRAPWSNSEWERQKAYIISIWSYCQNYMDFKAVPDESGKPRKRMFLSNKWLLKWPKDIDKLSRSAG